MSERKAGTHTPTCGSDTHSRVSSSSDQIQIVRSSVDWIHRWREQTLREHDTAATRKYSSCGGVSRTESVDICVAKSR